MKRIIPLLLFLWPVLSAAAQSQVKIGVIHYDSLLVAVPEYAVAQQHLQALRQQYEAEASYNEEQFKRLFTEFLQGQKDFPQNIMLKRQRDLQDQMEKSLAFRHECDSLLRRAEAEMLAPIRQRLDEAIRSVGIECGYEYIYNADTHALPFVHPLVSEDATARILEKLNN